MDTHFGSHMRDISSTHTLPPVLNGDTINSCTIVLLACTGVLPFNCIAVCICCHSASSVVVAPCGTLATLVVTEMPVGELRAQYFNVALNKPLGNAMVGTGNLTGLALARLTRAECLPP